MNYLPLFVDTSGKKCLVVGGGNVASRKLIPILKSDMDVNLVAPEINEDICELAENYKNLILEKRKFEKKDIDNQFLVLATTNDTNINSLIPASKHSSKIYSKLGLPLIGKSSFGITLVKGSILVPNPASGIIACFII